MLHELDAQKGNLLLGHSAREATKLLEQLQKVVCSAQVLAQPPTTSSTISAGSTISRRSIATSSSSSSMSVPVYHGQTQQEVNHDNQEKLARAVAMILADDRPPIHDYPPGYDYVGGQGGGYNSFGSATASVGCMGRMGNWFGGQQASRGSSSHAGGDRRGGWGGNRGYGIFGGLKWQDQRQLVREVQRMIGGALRGDDGIVDCMLYFQSKGHQVTLVTNDRVLRLRAMTEGVSIADIREWRCVVAGAAAGGSLWG